MERNEDNLCCGCLCVGRKMIEISDLSKRHCFTQIINEIPIFLTEAEFIWLCWECEASITKFHKFKKQVKECYKTLHDYRKQNSNTKILQCRPKLHTQQVVNLEINPEQQMEFEYTIEVLKTEPKSEIKEEDNHSTYSDNFDDDTALLEYSNRKKKKRDVKKKKKKEKEDVVKIVELTTEVLLEERRLLLGRDEYVNAMFRCEKCILSFPNGDDLNDHINIKHDKNKSNFKCSICECTFSSEVSYNYHTNKHRRRYQCTVCTENFRSKRAVTKHYEMIHCSGAEAELIVNGTSAQNGHTEEIQETDSTKQEVTFPCEFCHKTFRWKTSLRKHAETHRIETGQKRKPYCEPCRLSFTTTANLQKHVKTSSKHQIQLKLRKLKEANPEDSTTPEKVQANIEEIKCTVNNARQQYSCPHCDKRFQWRGNLHRHTLSHLARANGELVCEPCNRTFSSIATYKQHMKISKKHVSENDFKYMCSDCGKKFANKTRLKDHVDWEHLKNYVHTCNVCQKVFKSHTSLYLHKQVVHKKDNAEKLCDHCGKHFPNHAKLRSHIIALHTSEAPYKCTWCDARFSWHSCLSRHARRVHRDKR